MKKKILVLFLLIFILTVFSINVFAYTGWYYVPNGLPEIETSSCWYKEVQNPYPYPIDYVDNTCKRPIFTRGTAYDLYEVASTINYNPEVMYYLDPYILDNIRVVFPLFAYTNNGCLFGSRTCYTSGTECYMINDVPQEPVSSVWCYFTMYPIVVVSDID